MGTNYYTKLNECKECKRYDEVHLGKSSAGWQFSFQYNGGQYYKNVEEMKEWLSDKNITNEYGEDVHQDDFWEMVKDKQKFHDKDLPDYYPSSHDYMIDGYSFTDCEFS